MSIRDLFNKKEKGVSLRSKSSSDYGEAESIRNVSERVTEEERYIPQINFQDPSEFAKYGLAEKYYRDAIQQIYKTYPYDGALSEKQKWKNESSDLVNYFFEELYPRTNGFVNIGQNYGSSSVQNNDYHSSSINEYIYFKGTYNDGNIHDLQKNRGYNIKIDGEEGNTVEFYFKRDNLSGSHKQIILDIWNGEQSSSSGYGRMTLETHPGVPGEEDKFYFTIMSGTDGYVDVELGTSLDFIGAWHHYAISYNNSGSQIEVQLLVDGDVVDRKTGGSSIGRIYGAVAAQIGSLITAVSGTSTDRGWGKLSGSLDEFRFWKKKRTDKQVALNYFTQVGGGVNTDDANVDLGVYYKFNEGVYNTGSVSEFDKIVLDYSGRLSNGSWTGYSVGSRQTGSAFILSEIATSEFMDPIVYSNHPSILQLIEEYESVGYEYDIRNNGNIYNSLPGWKIEEDQESGKSTQNLMQIMSEIFDDINNKIKFLPQIKNLEYGEVDSLSLSSKLLQNSDLDFIEIFDSAEIKEMFLDRNDTTTYEEKIYKIKNSIYKNIYNNLLSIYKTKGTKKSFRNLLHCFGIDENLLMLQMYSDGEEFEIKDRFSQRLGKKTAIDFTQSGSHGGVIWQREDSSDSKSIGYIKPSTNIKTLGSTLEVEVMFPEKKEINEPLYHQYNYYSSSLFGMHENDSGSWAATDRADFQVYAIRKELESKDVSFKISSSYLGIEQETDVFPNVYNEKKWNFAIKIRPEKYPVSQNISGSTIGNYVVEFYGCNFSQDIKEESFLLTASVTSSLIEDYYSANKTIYIGAHRQDFSGSIISKDSSEENKQYTDIELFSARYWNSYLQNDTIDLHAKSLNNYGANDKDHKTATQLLILDNGYGSASIDQNRTLALHWNYLKPQISSGEFSLPDYSSGSAEFLNEDYMSPYVQNTYTGYGKHFSQIKENVKYRHLNFAEAEQPETITPEDLVEIVNEDELNFKREAKIVDYYFALEKNMYKVISKEMIRWLGTVSEFNNILGQPKNRYEANYRELDTLRNLFYRNVENEPDFDKFVEFYKWIDNSISYMVEQLIPASVTFSPSISNIVESHVFERNKFRHKMPTLEMPSDLDYYPFRGVNELTYNWKYGHAPISGLQSENCNWWLERAERDGSLGSIRNEIFQVISQTWNRKFQTPVNFGSQVVTTVGRKEKAVLAGTILTKKGQQDIIINEISFDPFGTESVVITDLIPSFVDCDDE